MQGGGSGRVIGAALLLLAAAPAPEDEVARAQAGLEESDPGETCEEPQTQSAMNACAGIDYARADADLNAQWKETVAAVKALDADIDRTYDHQPGHYDTLLKAQRAWLAYRDAHCLLDGFQARGGTMQPLLELTCKAYLTEQRTQELREIAAGPEYEG